MILDKLSEVIVDGDLTSHALSSAFDMGSADAAAGEPVNFGVSAPAAAGTGPVVLTITSCATSGGSYTALQVITITTAQLVAGSGKFNIQVPHLQYIKILPSGSFTGGTLDVFVTPDVQTNQ